MVEIVLLDMDGVIFEGKSFWLDFHRRMKTETQAWQLWDGLGHRDYKRLGARTADIWKDRPSNEFWELINSRTLVPGIEDLFAFLNDNLVKTAIISSGPYQLAQRAQRLFHISEIRANKLYIAEDGSFTGHVEIQVDENDKRSTAEEVMAKLGGTFSRAAMVGDSASDAGVAELVAIPIAYDSTDDALLRACRYRIAAGEMRKVIDLLREQGR
jgi:HAD superfamily phosphoserine phosphatase-like hydrolase